MKNLFTMIAIAILLFVGSMTVSAQDDNYSNSQRAYEYCMMFVQQGDEDYVSGEFVSAKTNYQKALDCNANCIGKKYASDRKILKKIDNCNYAISHGGITREQKSAQVAETLGSVLAVAAVAGIVAGATSHHEVHHFHGNPFPPQPHHHNEFPHFGPQPHHHFH